MDEFLILLQAKLDEAKSKNNVNADIDEIQTKLDKLKIQAEIDPKTVSDIVNQLESILNQKITISNIGIDQSQSVKAAQKTGQHIGNAINQGVANTVKKANDALKSFTDLKSFSELNKSINNFHVDTSELKNYKSILDEVKNTYSEFGQVKITNEIFKDGILEKFKVNIEQVNGDLKETKSFIMALNDEKDAFVFSGLISGSESIVQHLDKTKNAVNQTAEAINTLKEKAQIDKIQFLITDRGDITTQIKTLNDSFTKLGLSANDVKAKMNGVNTELTELKAIINNGANNSAITSQFDKLQAVLKETQNDLRSTRSEYSLLMSTQQRLSKANEIEAWNQKNSKATKAVRSANEEYIISLRNLNSQMTRMQFNDIVNGFKKSELSMRGLNKLGASITDQLSQASESFTQWLSVSSGIMFLFSKTKDAVSEIKELDDVLTEVSKTSDLTLQELKKLGLSSYDTASKYGRTASDYLSGVQSMSQSGFYGAKGEAMAEQSLLAQAAGDMSQEIADKYVLATNAAYKFNGEAKKLNEVLDGQNSISNRNSVALEDMALAMSEAGTVASSYRVSVEDLSAMIGTIESVTKSGGSEVGNSLKSILINLQNITSDKIVTTLNSANASMTEFINGAEQLRDPVSILRDLAKTFNELDEADPLRAEILTNIGGKYQAAKLAALLQNMDMFDKMLVDYSEGTGSALEEANKSATNLTGTLNTLSNSWNEFVNSLIDSDTLKIGVQSLNSLTQGATNLVNTFGSLGTIGLSAGLFAGFKNAGRVKCNPSQGICLL